jgi:4-hydroxy-2-oxoheptanedioate aldolase
MGFDWLCVDLQHGMVDAADLWKILAVLSASPSTPLVRVAGHADDQIGRALDSGAQGVIVPMVNTAAQARAAAMACRYPPAGHRSCGPVRSAAYTGADYMATANQELACIVMIETPDGLENVEAIAAEDGVDALFIGPVDLCFAVGVPPGDFAAPAFQAAVDRILAAGRSQGRPVGIFGYSPEMAAQWLSGGFAFASAGTDAGFMRSAAEAARALVRGPAAAEDQRG